MKGEAVYWEVHPGEATVSDVRRLLREAMTAMPRRIRVGIQIVEGASDLGPNTLANISVKKRQWNPTRMLWIPKTFLIKITRRSLFLPRLDLLDVLKHELAHAIADPLRLELHTKDFYRIERQVCGRNYHGERLPLADLRCRTWKQGEFLHDA